MVIMLLIGVAVGAVAGLNVGRSQVADGSYRPQNEDAESLNEQLEAARTEIAQLETSRAEMRAQLDGANQQLIFVKSQLAQAQRAEQIRIEHERERAAAQAEAQRAEQAQRLQEQSRVIEALAPVQKNLDALQNKVIEIEEGRKREMGALGQQLKGLGEQQTRLDKETNALSAALSNNKIRGAWGEAQLRNIVESAGLLEHVDFDTQVMVKDAAGHDQRPDMVVHLPGGKTIPIDAKVPYSDYQRACTIPDTASPADLARRAELMRAHAKAMREHVRLETDPTLLDDAFARKVALTSPVTLWAVLKSVAYAWQQQSLTDDAKTLFDLSRELYERFAKLGEHATKLGTQLTRTVAAYNAFVSSLESRVLPTARKLQNLDPSTVIGEVPMLDSDKINVTELTAPEAAVQEDERGE